MQFRSINDMEEIMKNDIVLQAKQILFEFC